MSAESWILLGRIADIISVIMFLATLATASWTYMNRVKIWEKIRRLATRNHFPKEVGHPLDNKIQWDALIFTVSKYEVPIWVIEQLKPKHIGLIATEKSQAVAAQIEADAQKRQIGVLTQIIADPDDLEQTRAATQSLATELRQQGCTAIAVDLTGGKVTMSLGAFMEAEDLGLHSLYVSTEAGADLKTLDQRTAKILCVSEPQ
jgi:hypothetical protein